MLKLPLILPFFSALVQRVHLVHFVSSCRRVPTVYCVAFFVASFVSTITILTKCNRRCKLGYRVLISRKRCRLGTIVGCVHLILISRYNKYTPLICRSIPQIVYRVLFRYLLHALMGIYGAYATWSYVFPNFCNVVKLDISRVNPNEELGTWRVRVTNVRSITRLEIIILLIIKSNFTPR
jgi:hypothetical protein